MSNDDVTVLESFPNELLIELFRYFSTTELFEIFFFLNFRFHQLIKSLSSLSFSSDSTNSNVLSFPFVRTLKILTPLDDRFSSLFNIRRLYLNYVTDELLQQLTNEFFPNLEYLSIDRRVHPSSMPELRRRVFSNEYPHLHWCYLSRIQSAEIDQKWSQTPSLRVLRVNEINGQMFIDLLVACPNLIEFRWTLANQSSPPIDFIEHHHLRRMMINMTRDEWPWNDQRLEEYLRCVPSLTQFAVHRVVSADSQILNHLEQYDWLATILHRALTVLNRFVFRLNIHRYQSTALIDLQQRWKRNFQRVHQHRYRSRLEIC